MYSSAGVKQISHGQLHDDEPVAYLTFHSRRHPRRIQLREVLVHISIHIVSVLPDCLSVVRIVSCSKMGKSVHQLHFKEISLRWPAAREEAHRLISRARCRCKQLGNHLIRM